MSKFIQVVDGVVVAVFPGPQDPAYWPGIEEVADDDPRLVTYYAAVKQRTPAVRDEVVANG